MNRFASTLAVTAVLLSALSVSPATAAAPTTPAAVEAAVSITAPAAVVKFERVEVGTVAAPVIVKAAAPKAAVKVKAPAKAAVKAVRKAVTQPLPIAPAPTVDPYSGNEIVDCAALGLVRVEDYSCVAPSFNAPVTGTDAPFTFQPCDEEDDTVTSSGQAVDSCYWDAAARGNGKGMSFTKFANGDIVYDRK